MKVKQALTTKLGPLPRWAWAVIVMVIIVLYLRHKANVAAQAAASTDPTATQGDPNAVPLDQQSAYASPYTGSDGGAPYYDTGAANGASGGSFWQGVQYGQGLGTPGVPTPTPTPNAPTSQGSQPIAITVINGKPSGSSTPSTPTASQKTQDNKQATSLLTGGGNVGTYVPDKVAPPKPPPVAKPKSTVDNKPKPKPKGKGDNK